MRRRAWTIALVALGSVAALGLLYWRFPSSFPFVDRRPKTEIFAEAFGRNDFVRCYCLMSDEYRAKLSESEYEEYWKHFFRPSTPWTRKIGQYNGFHVTTQKLPKMILPVTSFPLGPVPQHVGWEAYNIQYTSGHILLWLATRDGDTHSAIEQIIVGEIGVPLRLRPPPRPKLIQDPIS